MFCRDDNALCRDDNAQVKPNGVMGTLEDFLGEALPEMKSAQQVGDANRSTSASRSTSAVSSWRQDTDRQHEDESVHEDSDAKSDAQSQDELDLCSEASVELDEPQDSGGEGGDDCEADRTAAFCSGYTASESSPPHHPLQQLSVALADASGSRSETDNEVSQALSTDSNAGLPSEVDDASDQMEGWVVVDDGIGASDVRSEAQSGVRPTGQHQLRRLAQPTRLGPRSRR